MYHLVLQLDDIGKPAWIALMVLGFIVFWPVGLAILAFLIWSGRMGCGRNRDWQTRFAERYMGRGGRHGHGFAPSGNRAFDEYREETLRRLEDERREFQEFVERLRMAKDRAEFDQFMSERRARPEGSPPPSPAA